MKNKLLAAAIFLLPLALFVCFWKDFGLVQRPAPRSSPDAAIAHALATASPQTTEIIRSNFAGAAQTVFYSPAPRPQFAPAGEPKPLEFTNLAPEIILANLRHAIQDYRSMFGGNPVGENAEITAQLQGQNPKQANFLQPDAGMRLNGLGQLVDPWGTPLFFHQLSGSDMEIRSAGPDRILWTMDDLVVR